MRPEVKRWLGWALIALGAATFIPAFFVLMTRDPSSSCSDLDCFESPAIWVPMLFVSTLVGLTGAMLVSRNARGPQRWTRTRRNLYAGIAVLELALGVMFVLAGALGGEVAGGMITGSLLTALGVVLAWLAFRAAARDRLHDTGVPGVAAVTSMRQTGVYTNNNPLIELQLDVTLEDGRPTYRARHRETVPLMLLGRLTSGEPLRVKADRRRPDRLVIDWERP